MSHKSNLNHSRRVYNAWTGASQKPQEKPGIFESWKQARPFLIALGILILLVVGAILIATNPELLK